MGLFDFIKNKTIGEDPKVDSSKASKSASTSSSDGLTKAQRTAKRSEMWEKYKPDAKPRTINGRSVAKQDARVGKGTFDSPYKQGKKLIKDGNFSSKVKGIVPDTPLNKEISKITDTTSKLNKVAATDRAAVPVNKVAGAASKIAKSPVGKVGGKILSKAGPVGMIGGEVIDKALTIKDIAQGNETIPHAIYEQGIKPQLLSNPMTSNPLTGMILNAIDGSNEGLNKFIDKAQKSDTLESIASLSGDENGFKDLLGDIAGAAQKAPQLPAMNIFGDTPNEKKTKEKEEKAKKDADAEEPIYVSEDGTVTLSEKSGQQLADLTAESGGYAAVANMSDEEFYDFMTKAAEFGYYQDLISDEGAEGQAYQDWRDETRGLTIQDVQADAGQYGYGTSGALLKMLEDYAVQLGGYSEQEAQGLPIQLMDEYLKDGIDSRVLQSYLSDYAASNYIKGDGFGYATKPEEFNQTYGPLYKALEDRDTDIFEFLGGAGMMADEVPEGLNGYVKKLKGGNPKYKEAG